MKFISCILLLTIITLDTSAQTPRVLRKPVAEFSAFSDFASLGPIDWATLSPDGKFVTCRSNSHTLSTFTVYAVEGGRPLLTRRVRDVSPFLASDPRPMALRTSEFAEVLSALNEKAQASDRIGLGTAVALVSPYNNRHRTFSPDGKKLAVANNFSLYHYHVYVFDTTTGKMLSHPVNDMGSPAEHLLFSPDGKRLIVNNTAFSTDSLDGQPSTTMELWAGMRKFFFQGDKLYGVLSKKPNTIHEVIGNRIEKKSVGSFGSFTDHNEILIAGNPALAAVQLKNQVSIRNREGKELFRVVGEDSPIYTISLSADARTLMIFRLNSRRVEVFRLAS